MNEPRVPWDRRTWIALAVLVAASLASLPWTVHPWYELAGDTNDAAMYIASGRALLAGQGYSYFGEPFTLRPPGVSAMVAAVFALRGTDFHALNLVTSLFGVAAVALLFVYARERVGTALSFVIALALWLDSDFQRLCNQTLSDVPGIAIVLGCLVLERWSARRPSTARGIALGAAIGAATYVRTVAIGLLPAIVGARALARWRAREGNWMRWVIASVLPFVLAAIAVKLPLDLRSIRQAPSKAVDQVKLYSYSTGMWHVDPGDPDSPLKSVGEILEPVPERIVQIGSVVGSGLRRDDSIGFAVLGWLAIACIAWCAWKRCEPGDWFALANVALLLVYFDFGARIVLPVFVLALPATAECIASSLARFHAVAARSVPIAVFAVAGALWFAPRRGWDEIRTTHERMLAFASQLPREVSANARLGALRGWHYAVYLDRPVYSLRHTIRRAKLHGDPVDDAVARALKEYAIDFVLLDPEISIDRDLQRYFGHRRIKPRIVAEAYVYDAKQP